MTSDRRRTLSPAGLCRADLAAARGFETSYDSGRGAARLAAALAASSVATASATSAITKSGVSHGLATKAIGLLALSGAVLTSDDPRRGAPTTEAPALVAIANDARVVQAPPREGAKGPAPSATHAAEPPASTSAAAWPLPPPPPKARKRALNGFGREVADVTRARALLAADPSAALSAAESPAGSQALAEEREIIAIRALVSLGRSTEAKVRARDFVARRPGSPFAATARALAAD
jgi:hypothetical protein